MKRLFIVLVALGLLVASTAPAGANRPPAPDLMEVTMVGDLDTASCGGPILMEESRKGVLTAGEVLSDREDPPPPPRIWINALLPWGRNFPAPTSGADFSGCHGGPVDGSPHDWDGFLRITPTAEGVEILWIFDHYWEDGVPKPRGKKTGLIIENFFLRGEAEKVEADFYTGEFTISYFLRDDGNGENIQYADPGTVELSFQLSIDPYSP